MRNILACLVAAFVALAAPLASVAATAKNATEFYLQYRAAWDHAASMEDVLPYLVKQVRTEYEATPQPQRQPMFDSMKTLGALTGVKVVKESKRGDDVYVLELTAVNRANKPAKGIAEIVLEGGAMKVKSEHWTS
jgi:hypothetical protein